MFIGHLFCDEYSFKCFLHIDSFNSHNNSKLLVGLILQETAQRG